MRGHLHGAYAKFGTSKVRGCHLKDCRNRATITMLEMIQQLNKTPDMLISDVSFSHLGNSIEGQHTLLVFNVL